MTVKEAVSVLKSAKVISLGWDGCAINLDKNDILMMDAYGKYKVASIQAVGNEEAASYEINIAMRPVKEEN